MIFRFCFPHIIMLSLVMSLSSSIHAQKDAIYLNRAYQVVTKSKEKVSAFVYRLIDQEGENKFIQTDYYIGPQKIVAAKKTFRDQYLSLAHGLHQTYFKNAKPKSSGMYGQNHKEGDWVYYWVNGQIRESGAFEHQQKHGTWKRYTKDGKLWAEENYHQGLPHGNFIEYWPDGQVRAKFVYQMGKPEGEWVSYHVNGRQARQETYQNGELSAGKCFTSAGQDTTYYPFLVLPYFPGCTEQGDAILQQRCGDRKMLEFIQKNLKYPLEAQINNRAGIVTVGFYVEPNGDITEPFFIEEVSEEIAEECLRLIRRFPLWIPGQKDGRPDRVAYELNVTFRLD